MYVSRYSSPGVGCKVKEQKAMSIDIIHLGMDLLMWKKR